MFLRCCDAIFETRQKKVRISCVHSFFSIFENDPQNIERETDRPIFFIVAFPMNIGFGPSWEIDP